MDLSRENNSYFDISKSESFQDMDWDGLVELCKDREEKLNVAGTYGMKLLEQLNEAETHMDEQRVQHQIELEKLVQEIFELKSKLDLRSKLDLEYESTELHKQLLQKHEREKEEYKKELTALKKEKNSFLADLEQSHLREQQANEKIERLEEKITSLKTSMEEKSNPSSTGNISLHMFELEEQIQIRKGLEDEIEKLLSTNQELKNETQRFTLAYNANLKEVMDQNKELKDNIQTYSESLQEAKEEVVLLQTENRSLKSSNHLKTGNSLFAEVDDERKEMHKKLTYFQIRYESLSKAYNFLKKENHRMKSQVLSLLQYRNGKTELERINNLQRALSQANAENQDLMNKIKLAESNQLKQLSEENIHKMIKSLPDSDCNRDLVDLINIQLQDTKNQLMKKSEELDYIQMIKLAETEKLMKSEQKLYQASMQMDKDRDEILNLKLKLEETKNMLAGETQKRIMVEKKFDYDSKDDVVPLGIVSEKKSKGKRILPPTIAKAIEKNKEPQSSLVENWKHNDEELKSFKAVMKEKYSSSKTNEKQVESSKSNNSKNEKSTFAIRSRKVAFKEGVDTIEDSEANNTLSTDLVKENIKPSEEMSKESRCNTESKSVPNSVLKKKNSMPSHRHQQFGKNVANDKSKIRISQIHMPTENIVNQHDECKVQ